MDPIVYLNEEKTRYLNQIKSYAEKKQPIPEGTLRRLCDITTILNNLT